MAECDSEVSIMRRPWPNGGLLSHGKVTKGYVIFQGLVVELVGCLVA